MREQKVMKMLGAVGVKIFEILNSRGSDIPPPVCSAQEMTEGCPTSKRKSC